MGFITKAKTIFLSLFVLLILSGCGKETVNLEFHNKVALRELELAQSEIINALKEVAVVTGFVWYQAPDDFKAYTGLDIEFKPNKDNPMYSTDLVVKMLKGRLTYVPPKVDFEIKITENRSKVLKLLKLRRGASYQSELDWAKASIDVFSLAESESQDLIKVKHVCAIKVPLKTELPYLIFTLDPKMKGMISNASILSQLENMSWEAKYTYNITGLPFDKALVKPYFNAKVSATSAEKSDLFLIFEEVGTSEELKTTYKVLWKEPKNVNKRTCINKMKTKADTNVDGLLGSVTAVNNVVKVQMM